MRVHHIGYVCKSIEKSILDFEFLLDIKSEIKDKVYDSERGAFFSFISVNNDFSENNKFKKNLLIELVEPVGEDSETWNFLKSNKNRAALHHICYETSMSLNDQIEQCQKQGFILVKKPEPAFAMQNKKVAFLLSNRTGLIEIVEG